MYTVYTTFCTPQALEIAEFPLDKGFSITSSTTNDDNPAACIHIAPASTVVLQLAWTPTTPARVREVATLNWVNHGPLQVVLYGAAVGGGSAAGARPHGGVTATPQRGRTALGAADVQANTCSSGTAQRAQRMGSVPRTTKPSTVSKVPASVTRGSKRSIDQQRHGGSTNLLTTNVLSKHPVSQPAQHRASIHTAAAAASGAVLGSSKSNLAPQHSGRVQSLGTQHSGRSQSLGTSGAPPVIQPSFAISSGVGGCSLFSAGSGSAHMTKRPRLVPQAPQHPPAHQDDAMVSTFTFFHTRCVAAAVVGC